MNRRQLLNLGAGAMVGALIAREGIASDLPLLAVDDPIAKALGYAEDASTVDPAKYPKKAGPGGDAQRCDNCTLYQSVSGDAGTCGAVPGKLVKAAGWCTAWAPQA